ncbi:hypothetical protein [Kitasatospora sp. NPDC093806]|uniref:hypothetical protein n=1 Tax=Kitasatospora sp. NPDC093806 TaxID=3155075 RepID=UPI00341C8994
MLAQHLTGRAPAPLATRAELDALGTLMVEDEAVLSDAPTYRPEAAAILLIGLALLLSPKQPKEKR